MAIVEILPQTKVVIFDRNQLFWPCVLQTNAVAGYIQVVLGNLGFSVRTEEMHYYSSYSSEKVSACRLPIGNISNINDGSVSGKILLFEK